MVVNITGLAKLFHEVPFGVMSGEEKPQDAAPCLLPEFLLGIQAASDGRVVFENENWGGLESNDLEGM